MRKTIMRVFSRLSICYIANLLLCLSACHSSVNKEKMEGEKRRLATIDDSVEVQSPQVRKMIEQGMREAGDSLTYYEYYVRMAKCYYLSSTPDSLIPILDKTMAFAVHQPKSERKNSLLAFAYNCRAAYYHNFHKNPDEVVRLYKKAYTSLYDSDTPEQMPKVCANIGDAYIFKNQLPEAAYWYRRALFLVDSLRLPQKENITLYMGLATIYQQLNDFDAALKYYRQTERYFPVMTLSMQSYFLNNYGNYYYYTKDYKASLKKFLALKDFLESHGRVNTFDMYLCKVNLADVYLNLGDVKSSEKYLDEVEPVFLSMGDEVATYYVHTIRIGQAVKKGDLAAVRRILVSEKTTTAIDFNMRQIRNLYLRKYAEAMGNYREAYENLKEDMVLNDSLEHNRTNMRASEIMERFSQDTLKLHHNLAIEHKNAELQKANAIVFAAIGTVLVIILLFALWVMHSRKRYAQDKMNIMQLRLTSARNRISPHFVFNVLNNKIASSNAQEANELLELSRLIRANLDLSCQMVVCLHDELDFVQRYVNVERSLLGGDFEYHIKVSEGIDTRKICIPSMFVQILVENAFVHGLRGWEGHKILVILIERVDQGTRVTVSDNGPGFDIRSTGKKRTGLSIISQTMAVINERNKAKMSFTLHNRQSEDGEVVGCDASIFLPDQMKFPI